MTNKYQIELVNDPTDSNEPPYPREVFATQAEAEETALFRSANHGMAFRVVKVENDNTLTEINVFSPVKKRPVLRCRKCHQMGHAGEYPFSTMPGSGRCDDCV